MRNNSVLDGSKALYRGAWAVNKTWGKAYRAEVLGYELKVFKHCSLIAIIYFNALNDIQVNPISELSDDDKDLINTLK